MPGDDILMLTAALLGAKICHFTVIPARIIYLQTFVLVLPPLLFVRVCFGLVLN